jgi:predicted transcriptional regulator
VPVHDLADAGEADAGAGELLRGVQALEWLEQLVRKSDLSRACL